MRIIDDNYRKALLANRVYQEIINSRPDYTQLKKDAAEFERWIKKVHRRERAERAMREGAV